MASEFTGSPASLITAQNAADEVYWLYQNRSDVMLGSNNLSDVDTAATALGNIGGQPVLSEGAFVDGDKTKLDGIEAGATADQTGAEIDTLLDAEIGHSNWTIDWTADQGATNIDAGNIPDLSGTYQPLDADLTAIAGLSSADGNFIVGSASGWVAESGATARASLGVDAAGTDNSTDVTLAGSYDYLTISGQEITLGQIDLTTDVTGDLPVAEGGTGASNAAGAKTNLGFITDVVDDTTPQLGGDLDENDKAMTLDVTAGATVSIRDVVQLQADGKFDPADASAESTAKGMLAVATEAATDTNTMTVVTRGSLSGFSGLTAGSEYYLSETAGAITATKPTTSTSIVRLIGYALSTTVLYVDPDKSYFENA